MDRRLFLSMAAMGAGVLWLTPANALSSPVVAPPPGSAWTAWTAEALRQHSDPRVRAIAHAILSPNPQNLQPWLCELAGEDRIILRTGGERRLAASDQNDRQLTVGFGTFSELLVLAAEADGYAVDLSLFPEGETWPTLETRPVAIFKLAKHQARRDPLLDVILARHTNRTPFDETRRVTSDQVAQLRAAARNPRFVHTNLDRELASKIQDITLRAYDAWMAFAPTRQEVARWTHVGDAAIAANPYGPVLTDATLAKTAGQQVSFATLADPGSAQFKANRAGYRKAVQTGWAHLWIAVPDFDRKHMFAAGRDWVRLHLKATSLGLDVQPHSQSIQNFPEIDRYVREIHEALGVTSPSRIQMLGRIGYGSPVPPSPRLPASAHVRA